MSSRINYYKNFDKSIPFEKRKGVYDKILKLKNDLELFGSFQNLPIGYSIRRVKGRNLWKLRVNQSERIVFSQNKDSIDLLFYSNHDDQIRRSRAINISNLSENSVHIDDSEETEVDTMIEDYLKYEYQSEFLDALEKYELNEETVVLSVEDSPHEKKYLTEEQFYCIRSLDRFSYVQGCAGSGKTLIGIRKLLINESLNIKTAYITHSRRLKDQTQRNYEQLGGKSNGCITFHTLDEVCMNIVGIDANRVVHYPMFKNWYKNHTIQVAYKIPAQVIWYDIVNQIKGSADNGSRIISEDEYSVFENSKSPFLNKKYVYTIALQYDKWLLRNNLMDVNDLYREALRTIDEELFENLIFDESQELLPLAIKLLKKIVISSGNMLLLSDNQQRIIRETVNSEEIMKLSEDIDINYLDKNFRSGSGTVEWLNSLKAIEHEQWNKKYFIQCEKAMRFTPLPTLVIMNDEYEYIFSKVSNSTTSIIIVGDDDVREELITQSIDISRVFTVSESIGLEYDKVICFKLFEYSLKNESINYSYIAATRSIKQTIFIEENEDYFQKYFHGKYEIKQINEVVREINDDSDISQWLDEARELEKKEQYLQAAEAYNKAQYYKEELNCLKANELMLALFELSLWPLYIDMKPDGLNEQHLLRFIEELRLKYNITFKSWIQVVTYHISDNTPHHQYVYIASSTSSSEVADILNGLIKERVMTCGRITVKIPGLPNQRDFYLYYENKKLIIKRQPCEDIRKLDKKIKIGKSYEEIMHGVKDKSPMQVIIDMEKINTQSAESVLGEIFCD